jgi:hypothetical protein
MLAAAPRPMVEHVREADWVPDGSDLAIVRRAGGLERLEFPLGKVLYQTNGYISHIRFHVTAQRIAFADHPLYGDDNGDLSVVDRAAPRRRWPPAVRTARCVLVARRPGGVVHRAASPYAGVALRASSLSGRTRTIRAPDRLAHPRRRQGRASADVRVKSSPGRLSWTDGRDSRLT